MKFRGALLLIAGTVGVFNWPHLEVIGQDLMATGGIPTPPPAETVSIVQATPSAEETPAPDQTSVPSSSYTPQITPTLAIAPQTFAGSGLWRSSYAAAGEDRPWRIHAVLASDGSVRAKLSVLGVPGMQDLTLEGQLIGNEAFGVLLGNDGTQVATFNATLSADGSGGSFILGSRDDGTWSYDSATKAVLVNPSGGATPVQ